jgi:hypothetical protein
MSLAADLQVILVTVGRTQIGQVRLSCWDVGNPFRTNQESKPWACRRWRPVAQAANSFHRLLLPP